MLKAPLLNKLFIWVLPLFIFFLNGGYTNKTREVKILLDYKLTEDLPYEISKLNIPFEDSIKVDTKYALVKFSKHYEKIKSIYSFDHLSNRDQVIDSIQSEKIKHLNKSKYYLFIPILITADVKPGKKTKGIKYYTITNIKKMEYGKIRYILD